MSQSDDRIVQRVNLLWREQVKRHFPRSGEKPAVVAVVGHDGAVCTEPVDRNVARALHDVGSLCFRKPEATKRIQLPVTKFPVAAVPERRTDVRLEDDGSVRLFGVVQERERQADFPHERVDVRVGLRP